MRERALGADHRRHALVRPCSRIATRCCANMLRCNATCCAAMLCEAVRAQRAPRCLCASSMTIVGVIESFVRSSTRMCALCTRTCHEHKHMPSVNARGHGACYVVRILPVMSSVACAMARATAQPTEASACCAVALHPNPSCAEARGGTCATARHGVHTCAGQRSCAGQRCACSQWLRRRRGLCR